MSEELLTVHVDFVDRWTYEITAEKAEALAQAIAGLNERFSERWSERIPPEVIQARAGIAPEDIEPRPFGMLYTQKLPATVTIVEQEAS